MKIKILIAFILTTLTVNAQKLGGWGWMLQTNAVFKNASNSFLGPINMNGNSVSNAAYIGATNYYDTTIPALPGQTNGPTILFRQSGSIPILWEDTQVGSAAAYIQSFSSSFQDLSYGYFTLNTTHNGSPPSGGNTEWVYTTPSHIAFLIGAGNAAAGHFQFGHLPGNGFGGYAGSVGGNGNNAWINMQPAQFLSQSAATSFSLAIGFNTHELQGAIEIVHVPGIFSYSIRTNAPGRWAMMFTGDLGNAAGETWDANTAKPQRVFEINSGDLTNALFFKPINYPTNLGTAAIDCSIPVSDQSTAVNITFTAPVNFDSIAKQYEEVIQIITNSAVGTITLTAPVNARLTGTTTVTRMCDVHWYIKIGKWTNGVVTQWF